MNNTIAPLLLLIGAAGLIGCESMDRPMSPTPLSESSVPLSPGSSDGPAAPVASKRPDTGPIVIDRGELDFAGGTGLGELRLQGNRGFSLTAQVDLGGGIVEAIGVLFSPGTPIPLRANWVGNDLWATVTLDGVTYTEVGSLESPASALVEFNGSVLAPPLTKRGFDQVTALFTMTGQFSFPEGFVTLSGEGVVRVWLADMPASTGWSVQRLLYRFKHRP